ncbi:carbon-nitrogen hydrolase family protein [Nocardioides sp. Kera G14]|uniref:carbon-nitrogen hydrolase family protein n=1 Tax=Nocardioides sp. Kera G14 TaxID=2884264 RepID=UPI001D113ED5|nr:carbon-nitrogen hydrolase family protein [Nocardioides sp. Kera G14]UDY23341.1 carbon-nitrogen hydrolase family protein [Nocardioides sp. Kera G14]
MGWEKLDVALVQAASGLDPAANTARLAELTPAGADLVVLPEVFQRDFGPVTDSLIPYAERLDGPFATELRRVSSERATTIVAGMAEATDGPPYNTLLVADGVTPATGHYRKIHLYDSFGYKESERLSAGPLTPTVVEVAGARVGLMTCYDLRFPELARALVAAGAEVLVVPAAWVAGERKVDHWRTLARARAIENTVYVAACGQPAPRYSGHSVVVDPLGDVLAEAGDGEETITATLAASRLAEARATNPSLANRRL